MNYQKKRVVSSPPHVFLLLMPSYLQRIRIFAFICGLLIIAAIVGSDSAWAQSSPSITPDVQKILDRVSDSEKRKDWVALRKIGEEVIARDTKAWGGWYLKGVGHFYLGELSDAVNSFKETVTLNPSFADAWSSLGSSYAALGEETKAIEAFEKAVQVNPKYVIAWLNLWERYNTIGNREKVREVYLKLKELDPESTKQAIAAFGQPEDPHESSNAFSTEIHASDNPDAVRDALLKLDSAESLIAQERVEESLPLLEAAFKALTSNLGAGSDEALRARDYLVFAYYDLYRLTDLFSLIGSRNYRNSVVRIQPIHQQRITKYGERSEQAIRTATVIAFFLMRSGELAEAQQLITKTYANAMEILGEEHRATLTAALVKEAMYSQVGQGDEAVASGEKVVLISSSKYGESDPLAIAALSELGLAYISNGMPRNAIPHLEKAHELLKKSAGENSRPQIKIMSLLGVAYAASGRSDEALKMAERTAQISEKTFGKNSSEAAESLIALSVGYLTAKRFEDGINVTQRAIATLSNGLGPNDEGTLAAKGVLAIFYVSKRRFNEALALLEPLVQNVEKQRASSDFSSEEKQRYFSRFALYYRLYAFLLATKQPEESFRIGELSKARTLLESTAMKRANDSGLLSESDALKMRGFEKDIGDINDRIANVSQNRSLKAKLESEKATIIHDFAEFRADLITRNPKYGRLSDVRIIGAQEGRNALPIDSVFISYLETHGSLLVFALDTSGGLIIKGIPQVQGLKEKLEKYREMLSDPSSRDSIIARPARNLAVSEASKVKDEPKSLQALSEFLGKMLLDPVAKQIRGKSRVIISPDGALALIPFETLLFDGKPLVMSYDVSYSQSLSMLSLLKNRKVEYKQIAEREELFAMGGANYSGRSAVEEKPLNAPRVGFFTALLSDLSHLVGRLTSSIKISENKAEQASKILIASRGDSSSVQRAFNKLEANWENLPGSEKEAKAVSEIFGKNKSLVLTRADASEQKLQELNQKQELRRYKYLLFSTHGYLSTYEPALSSIVLSQDNKTPLADGYVTASEWPSYDLNSDLVVLSACETGLGKVVQGEGVLGIPFALFVAGNTDTVITLWSIIDDSTSEFIQRFFRKIKDGTSESAALSQTKREFLQEKKYGRPVFWAPFVMYGY